MTRTNLKGFAVTQINVVNKRMGAEKIELQNSYNYNMRILDTKRCTGEFKITIKDKNSPELFNIFVACSAIFEYPSEKEKTDIHLESLSEMFPYVKSFIATLTANMGIATINIPPIDLSNISIVNVQFPPK